MRRRSVSPRRRQRGAALILALMSMTLLAAVGMSLAVLAETDLKIAANGAAASQALYAADGALEIAIQELLGVEDWNAVLAGAVRSAFADGGPSGGRRLADGATIDLTDATSALNAEPRPWGANNPRWQLFAYGPLPPASYLVAWVADDPAETDGDPSLDGGGEENPGAGVLFVRAASFGPAGAYRAVEARVRRTAGAAGQPAMEMLTWQEIR